MLTKLIERLKAGSQYLRQRRVATGSPITMYLKRRRDATQREDRNDFYLCVKRCISIDFRSRRNAPQNIVNRP